MRANRSIRNRRGRKSSGKGFELPLTPMIDVLVIILVFLLKSYQTSTNNLTTVAGLQMPTSISPDEPRDSLQVLVTPEGITFEGGRVLDFVQTEANVGATDKSAQYRFKEEDLKESGRLIAPLLDALNQAKEKSAFLKSKSTQRDADGQPLPFDGVLAITADKRVQYDTLRKIMYTAGAAEYKVFRFIAQRKEQ